MRISKNLTKIAKKCHIQESYSYKQFLDNVYPKLYNKYGEKINDAIFTVVLLGVTSVLRCSYEDPYQFIFVNHNEVVAAF